MWRHLAASVQGASHVRSGVPCQDFSAAADLPERGLLLACADGAGSARQAEVGAETACRALVEAVNRFADTGGRIDTLTMDTAATWLDAVRAAIQPQADAESLPTREFACTLVAALVVRPRRRSCRSGTAPSRPTAAASPRSAFRPEQGDVNTTYFVTGADAHQRLRLEVRTTPVHDVALFTDGLQHIALRYETRLPHQPFFDSMFARLRTDEQWPGVGGALASFLVFEGDQHQNRRRLHAGPGVPVRGLRSVWWQSRSSTTPARGCSSGPSCCGGGEGTVFDSAGHAARGAIRQATVLLMSTCSAIPTPPAATSITRAVGTAGAGRRPICRRAASTSARMASRGFGETAPIYNPRRHRHEAGGQPPRRNQDRAVPRPSGGRRRRPGAARRPRLRRSGRDIGPVVAGGLGENARAVDHPAALGILGGEAELARSAPARSPRRTSRRARASPTRCSRRGAACRAAPPPARMATISAWAVGSIGRASHCALRR